MTADILPRLKKLILIDLHICPSFCMASFVLIHLHTTLCIQCVCASGEVRVVCSTCLHPNSCPRPIRTWRYMTSLWVEGEAGSHVTICYIKSAHRQSFHSYTWTRLGSVQIDGEYGYNFTLHI